MLTVSNQEFRWSSFFLVQKCHFNLDDSLFYRCLDEKTQLFPIQIYLLFITGHPRLTHFNESILHLDTDLIFVSFTILDPAYLTHLKHSSTCQIIPRSYNNSFCCCKIRGLCFHELRLHRFCLMWLTLSCMKATSACKYSIMIQLYMRVLCFDPFSITMP